MKDGSGRENIRVLLQYLYVDCARNLAIHHALADYYFNVKNSEIDVWRVTSNSTRDYGIIQWCKLFGSYSE
jgi:hypothetical protein